MGTNVEWSHVALFVAATAVGIVFLERFVELVGVKNNPRESLVYLRHGVLLSLFFGMIQVFHERLLHRVILLFAIGVTLAIVASGDRKPAIFSPPKDFLGDVQLCYDPTSLDGRPYLACRSHCPITRLTGS